MPTEQSYRDDIESLAYTLIYLLQGTLPWDHKPGPNGEPPKRMSDREEMVHCRDMRVKLTPIEVADGCPREFSAFLEYSRKLQFGQKPDYGAQRKMFRRLFVASGFKHDNVYDWTEKMYNELKAGDD
jgi:hypothetical protein